MKMRNTKIYIFALLGCLAVAVVLASIPIKHVSASDDGLNLPGSSIVRIEVFNGTESYFNTFLMDVPSGYDVTNGTYPGWCVDTEVLMSRSPATHDAILYSSLDPPNGTLGDQRWDMVNYILNHKRGGATDIQEAIWHFIDFSNASMVPPLSDIVTWEIINDTLANGTGYVPAFGQTVAVICVPVLLLPQPTPVQINIIEVTNPVIPEFPLPAASFMLVSIILLAVLVYRRRNRLTRI
jgi:hypothetical protein